MLIIALCKRLRGFSRPPNRQFISLKYLDTAAEMIYFPRARCFKVYFANFVPFKRTSRGAIKSRPQSKHAFARGTETGGPYRVYGKNITLDCAIKSIFLHSVIISDTGETPTFSHSRNNAQSRSRSKSRCFERKVVS